MSAVKSRLKLFEPSQNPEDMANVRGVKPLVTNKPPVQPKLLKATEDAPTSKWGPGAVIKKDELNAVKNSLNKSPPPSTEMKSYTDNGCDLISKIALKPVNVPKIFQTDEASDTSKTPESSLKFPLKPAGFVKTPTLPSKVSGKPPSTQNQQEKSPDTTQQNVSLPVKPLFKTSSTPHNELSTPGSKPWNSKAAHATPSTLFSGSSAATAASSVAKSWVNKNAASTQSTTSASQTTPVKIVTAKASGLSSVTTSSTTLTATSPKLSTSPVQASQGTGEENEKGKFDFRSQMRQRNSVTLPDQPIKLTDQKLPLTDITPKNTQVTDLNNSNEVTLRHSPSKNPMEKKRQSSNIIIERKSDNKKFKKVRVSTLPPESSAPSKPALPSGIDLTQLKVEYQKKIQDLQNESDEANSNVNGSDELIYDEGYSAKSPVLPRRSTFKKNSQRISLIPDMGPEEEGEIYDDGTSQPIEADEIYTDGETEKKPEEFVTEDIYEDEESFSKPAETEEEKKKRLKEEAEAKKREEKERKEKEKLEKEQKKKEEKEKKEKMKLMKKLNITGNEINVGEGTIKEDCKGSGLNLTVKKGQTATIIRLNNNPANKWLVKVDENNFGYVESKNIEIDPDIIKQAMGHRKNSRATDDDQPTYDDVAGNGDDAFEEIYEEL